MLTNIIYYTDLILFCMVSFTVFYLFVFAISGSTKRSAKYIKSIKQHRFLFIVPAYQEDETIEETVKTIVSQDYRPELFDTIVVSDHMSEVTNIKLAQYPITLLLPKFKESSKAKSLNYAMDHRAKFKVYDMVIILDANNLIEPDFLDRVNTALCMGSKVVQCHRFSRNRDTSLALIDAVFEEINNTIFRRGHVHLGLSSALIGSGIAIDFHWFTNNVNKLRTASEDKELEALLLDQGIYIDYLNSARVFDGKTRRTKDFNKQRSRWAKAQLYNLISNFHSLIPALIAKRYDYADKIIQWLLIPRIIMVGIICIMSVAMPFINFMFALKWWGIFALTLFIFALATPDYLVDEKWNKAIMKTPIILIAAILNLFKLNGQNRFSHAARNKEETILPSKREIGR